MKDNKLYKVLRIIFLTLAIISLVFTLCKKVGLCASVEPSDYADSFPLNYGFGSDLGYSNSSFVSEEIILDIISQAQAYPYYASNHYFDSGNLAVFIREVSSNYIYVTLSDFDYLEVNPNYSTFPVLDSNTSFVIHSNHCAYIYYYSHDNVTFQRSYENHTDLINIGSEVEAFPSNPSTFYLPKNTDVFNYPIYADSSVDFTASNLLIFGSSGSGDSFLEGEVISLPNFEPLSGVPDSSDTQDSLFDKLKGWLSTIQGNIQKGFKNIEENLTSFFKPYLDNIKGFFEWVTEPFDSEAASDSLEAIQAISDIRALNNVIGTAGIFNWSDVSPASRVAFTFDFGGAVLPHHQYEINFDWYTGTVKTLILSILVTFLVVGLLVTIINNIPSMIHGHSGDSGGGSN